MENLLQGIPHVTMYIDDILVSGPTEAEHYGHWLQRLKRAALRAKKSKCEFMWHTLGMCSSNAQGLHPLPEKMILVLIDDHSKWIEAASTAQLTSQAVWKS